SARVGWPVQHTPPPGRRGGAVATRWTDCKLQTAQLSDDENERFETYREVKTTGQLVASDREAGDTSRASCAGAARRSCTETSMSSIHRHGCEGRSREGRRRIRSRRLSSQLSSRRAWPPRSQSVSLKVSGRRLGRLWEERTGGLPRPHEATRLMVYSICQ